MLMSICTSSPVTRKRHVFLAKSTWPSSMVMVTGRHTSRRLLFPEEVFPVCSPHYLGARQGRLAAEHLVDATLLDLDDDHWNWLNWRQWLSAHGAGQTVMSRPLTISSYPLVIDAARRGLGMALGWRGLVDDDLKAGRLVAPLRESLKTRFGYHMVWPRERTSSPAALAFITWARGAA